MKLTVGGFAVLTKDHPSLGWEAGTVMKILARSYHADAWAVCEAKHADLPGRIRFIGSRRLTACDEHGKIMLPAPAELKYEVEVSDHPTQRFHFRILCSDGRATQWAGYTDVAVLDGVAAVTGYYSSGPDKELIALPAADVLRMFAVGEAPPEKTATTPNVAADDSAAP